MTRIALHLCAFVRLERLGTSGTLGRLTWSYGTLTRY